MNPRDIRAYFFDVQKACGLILQFTRGVTRESFLVDLLLRSAVERQLEILGEAIRKPFELDPSLAQKIMDVRSISGFRDRLAYGYDRVDPAEVWDICQGDLSKLMEEMRILIDEAAR